MPAGTAIESILFSFALADRINSLKKENEQKQNEIIKHLSENEKHLTAVKEAELIVERLKKETLASQLESLKNQVNPHFLFNSLNVLTELIQQNQHRAIKFVEELSDVYRYVLESRSKTIIELGSELKFLEAFIYLLKIRFENKISVNINLKDFTYKKMIPPLSLQLLIENAIKHNIISNENPLVIEVYSTDDYLIVKNKIQLKSGIMKASGIGLKNIESRYGFLTDKKVTVQKEDDLFIVNIPLLSLIPDLSQGE
jgi:LytS/YehU family sensor histidine kinase